MKAIIDIKANVSIVILLVVRKLCIIMGMPNKSKIVAIDQTKKNVIRVMQNVLLSIQDTKVSVNLLVIDASEDNLLLGTD